MTAETNEIGCKTFKKEDTSPILDPEAGREGEIL
jgi:hypothetical protein